jgi:hypothetical protein
MKTPKLRHVSAMSMMAGLVRAAQSSAHVPRTTQETQRLSVRVTVNATLTKKEKPNAHAMFSSVVLLVLLSAPQRQRMPCVLAMESARSLPVEWERVNAHAQKIGWVPRVI